MTLFRHIVFVFSFMSLLLPSAGAAQAVSGYPSFADLAERLLPSVVNISTLHDKEAEDPENNIETNVETIFNKEKSNQVSLGSGFIIDENGYIITNNHVIDKASVINVVLADKTTAEAVIIGKDPKTDIALIKIDADTKLQPVKFGDSDKIRIGDWVLAIGNPFGLGGSVTAGIVSAKSRDIESGPYDSFIQTDASINQGSSGGPMFNMAGEVIGVNTAIFSTNGGSMGVGFAIPVNLIDFVVRQLKENGSVRRGWIGVKMQPAGGDITDSVGLKKAKGVLISSVNENSSAAKAGIKAGDIVLKFDGTVIDDTKNLSRMVAESQIGKTADFEIWRDGQVIPLRVLIEEMPAQEPPALSKEILPGVETQTPDLPTDAPMGISLSEVNAETINKYHLAADTSGVVVTEVVNGSDAMNKGLKEGDVITQIDKQAVFDVKTALGFINEAQLENNRPVLLQIKDNDVFHFVAVKLTENDQN